MTMATIDRQKEELNGRGSE